MQVYKNLCNSKKQITPFGEGKKSILSQYFDYISCSQKSRSFPLALLFGMADFGVQQTVFLGKYNRTFSFLKWRPFFFLLLYKKPWKKNFPLQEHLRLETEVKRKVMLLVLPGLLPPLNQEGQSGLGKNTRHCSLWHQRNLHNSQDIGCH